MIKVVSFDIGGTLLKNEETNEWYVLPSIYLNYVIFNEEVNMS